MHIWSPSLLQRWPIHQTFIFCPLSSASICLSLPSLGCCGRWEKNYFPSDRPPPPPALSFFTDSWNVQYPFLLSLSSYFCLKRERRLFAMHSCNYISGEHSLLQVEYQCTTEMEINALGISIDNTYFLVGSVQLSCCCWTATPNSPSQFRSCSLTMCGGTSFFGSIPSY